MRTEKPNRKQRITIQLTPESIAWINVQSKLRDIPKQIVVEQALEAQMRLEFAPVLRGTFRIVDNTGEEYKCTAERV